MKKKDLDQTELFLWSTLHELEIGVGRRDLNLNAAKRYFQMLARHYGLHIIKIWFPRWLHDREPVYHCAGFRSQEMWSHHETLIFKIKGTTLFVPPEELGDILRLSVDGEVMIIPRCRFNQQ